MNVRCIRLFRAVTMLCVPLALLLLPSLARAFELEGTSDLDIEAGDEGGTCTIVSLAGFDLVRDPRLNQRRLIGFVEYGPDEAVEGVCDTAGQLWFDVPASGSLGWGAQPSAESLYIDVTSDDALLAYEEWQAGGRTTFDGIPRDGWLDITLVVDASGLEILSVDVVLSVLVTDEGRHDERVIDGILFAGDLPQPSPSAPVTERDDRRYVRRSGGGCTGEGEVVIVNDPYYPYEQPRQGSGCDDDPLYDDPYYEDPYDSDSGCEGDSYDSTSSTDSGCESDSYDSSASTDPGCEGDSYDSTSSTDSGCESDSGSSSDSDSTDCEGDTFDEKSATGVGVAFQRLAPRGASYYLRRTLHFWAPLAFIVLGRRRRRPGM